MSSEDQQNQKEEPTQAAQTRKIGLDEIRDHIAAFWKSTACHRCGNDDWVLGSNPEIAAVLPVGGQSDISHLASKRILPAIWLMCRHCGYLEFISMKHVKELLDAKEKMNGKT
jgi:hypothetical protein